MSNQQKVTWAAAVGAIGAALTIAVFVARAVAQAEVAPVSNRVTALETQQRSTDKRLDEIASDVRVVRDCLISGQCRKP